MDRLVEDSRAEVQSREWRQWVIATLGHADFWQDLAVTYVAPL